jgi:hypothetical protein
MSTQTITEQFINGMRVVTTETVSDGGILRTHQGLLEALARPYENMSAEEVLELSRRRNRRILEEHKELISHFVN